MFVISGRWLGYVYLTCSLMSGSEVVVVVDLRTGRRHEWGITDTLAALADPYDTVEALAVAQSGAAAWIMSYAIGDDKRRMYEVRATDAGRRAGILLDAGPDVAPDSLAVGSGIVYWTRGGTPRSRPLR